MGADQRTNLPHTRLAAVLVLLYEKDGRVSSS
jgi:hypothetical protein